MSLTRQGGWHTLLCEGETQIGNSGTGVLTMQTLMHISTAGKRLFAVAWFCLIAGVPAICTEKTGGTLAIIPKPAKMEVYRGVFVIGPGTKVYLRVEDGGARRVGEYLSTLLSSSMGRTVPVQVAGGGTGRHRNSIYLLLKAPGTLGPEGYEMSVSPDAIRISATTVAGLFYGAQTLRQMLPPETQSHAPAKRRMEVPCVHIQDSPRFSWRGLMLDCSRTFLTMDYLKRSIDRMALYKLNILHLHLTDDQGWRLEIKKYPQLTTVAARFADRFGGGGGFYTQQEMRDLIAYARERNITIVPEIEMPGHSREVLATFPELACLLPERQTFDVRPFWEGRLELTQPLCVGNDKVFEMFQDVLSEVIDLFPSEFIHVGGDEVPKEAWKKCPRCQARIKAEGLKDEEEFQSYFIRRVEKMISAKGRRMVGWDEILEGGLAPGATVMSWRGTKGGVAAAQMGHDVVMTPNPYCYLDYTYHTTPSEQVYSYDPVAKDLTGSMAEHVLGVQASMWTHIAATEKQIDYQMYPRLLALAEVAWTPQPFRDWSDFDARLARQLRCFQLLDIKYFDPAAVGKKIGAWQASDLAGETPRVFEWDATPLLTSASEVEVQVRRDDGQKPVYVRSVALLADGKEISREVFPGPLDKYNDVVIGWLALGTRKAGARYTVRATLQCMNEGGLAGSVWIMQPPATESTARR
jgi:hexosaminidase